MTCFYLFLLGLLGVPSEGAADDSPYYNSKTPSAYCGLYCVYAAARCFQTEYPFENAIDTKYLHGKYGSTNEDLVNLLKDVGLDGRFRSDLTSEDLRRMTTPVILHVRSPTGIAYNHWALFTGFDDHGAVLVFDPPEATGPLSLAELMSIWDGSGVVVSKVGAPWNPWELPISISSVAILAATGGLMWWLGKRWRGLGLVTGVTVASCLIVHLGAEGFVRNPKGINSVIAAHFDTPLREIDFDDLAQGMDANRIVLVDAREPEAFQKFHLPEAINIPISSGAVALTQRIASLETTDAGKQIVVYCRSNQCGWADKVGSILSLRTSRNILVYREGVLGWLERSGKG